MKNNRIKDLMVPISEYAAVSVGTSLIDAIQALEEAQEKYSASKYQHRAILVLDEDGNVAGKISQLRALKAIEPEFDFTAEIEKLKKFHFSETYIAQLRDTYRSEGQIIEQDTLKEAGRKKVEDFMQTLSPGEFISVYSDLDMAIHKLVTGTHLSLLVTQNKNIVGILRISDVFTAVFREMESLHV